MKWVQTLWLIFADFFLRYVPLPVRPGLRMIGTPNKQSPVLVTVNNYLTVARVMQGLGNYSAYLVVLDSGGMDFRSAFAAAVLPLERVCAALRSSRLGDKIASRQAIVPSFCEGSWDDGQLNSELGWSLVYGPCDAFDLAYFFDTKTLTPHMHAPRFEVRERMALALSTSLLTISLFGMPLLLFGWPAALLVLAMAGVGFLMIAILYPTFAYRYKMLNGVMAGSVLGLVAAGYAYGALHLEWKNILMWFGAFLLLGLWCGYAYVGPFVAAQRRHELEGHHIKIGSSTTTG